LLADLDPLIRSRIVEQYYLTSVVELGAWATRWQRRRLGRLNLDKHQIFSIRCYWNFIVVVQPALPTTVTPQSSSFASLQDLDPLTAVMMLSDTTAVFLSLRVISQKRLYCLKATMSASLAQGNPCWCRLAILS
jgi:hypothetical protein